MNIAAEARKLPAIPIGNLENFQRERHIFDLSFARGMGRLSVMTPNIFRVQLSVQKNWTFKPLISLEDKEWKSVPLQIKKHQEKLDITTPRMIISIVFRPFNIRVYDHDGHLLSQDNPRNAVVFKGPRIIVNKKCPAGVPFLGLGDIGGPLDRSGKLHRLELQQDTEKDLKAHVNPRLVFPLFCHPGKEVACGYFLDNATSSLIDLRRTNTGEVAMATDDGELDYYWVIGKDIDEVARGFFTLVGNSSFPPRWTLEIMKGLESAPEYREFLRGYDPVRRDFVLTSSVMVHQPQGDSTGLWDDRLQRMLTGFRRADRIPHFMVELSQELPMEKLAKKDLRDLETAKCFLSADGEGGGMLTLNGSGYLDPFNDDSYQFVQQRFAPLLQAGLRGVEVKDACPPWTRSHLRKVLVRCSQEIVAEDGESIEKLIHEVEAHKLLAYIPNGLARCLYRCQLAAKPDQRPLVLTSSGFAGVQRYTVICPAHAASGWPDIPRYLTRLLSLNVSGAPLLCADIHLRNDFDERFMCGLAYALAFVPLIRLRFEHGVNLQKLLKASRFLDALHHVCLLREEWLPYLYDLLRQAHVYGVPILYPLAYFYPEWAPGRGVQTQFLLGPHVLVAPRVKDEAEREVELPEGRWADVHSFAVHRGGRKISGGKDPARLPMYYREGAIVPHYENKCEDLRRAVVVTIFPKTEAISEAEIYDDDGETTRYRAEEHSCIAIKLTSSHKGQVMKIARRQGRANPSWISYLFCFIASRLDIQRVVYNRTELDYSATKEELLKRKMGFHIDEERELLYIKIPYEREGGVVRF